MLHHGLAPSRVRSAGSCGPLRSEKPRLCETGKGRSTGMRLLPSSRDVEEAPAVDPEIRATELFDEAEAYWRAAVELEKAGLSDAFAALPVRNLYYHSIDLYLKSFLCARGLLQRDLDGRFRNDFRRMRRQCQKRGLVLEKPYSETLEYFVVTPLPLRLKFSATGFYRVPTVRALDELCQVLRDRVAPSPLPAISAR